MAKVRERVMKKPMYWCEACDCFYEGEVEEIEAIHTENLPYGYIPLKDVKSHTTTVLTGKDCGCVGSDGEFTTVAAGETLYECAECDQQYFDSDDAQYCC